MEDTAELERAILLMVVPVAAVVGTYLLKESLLELPVKVIRAAVQTALATVLVVVVVVQVVSVPMRTRYIVAVQVESVSLR